MHKPLFALLLLTSLNAHANNWNGGWGNGVDPDHDPRRFERHAPVPVDQCTAQVDGQEFNLNQNNPSLDTVLDFVANAPAAKAKVRSFRKELAAGEIHVAQFNDEVRRNNPAEGVVATFEYIPETNSKTIYVDFTGELGVVAVQFYHEMTHSLDTDGVQAFIREYVKREAVRKAKYEEIWDRIAARLHKAKTEVDPSELTAEEKDELTKLQKAIAEFKNDGTYRAEFLAFSEQMKMLKAMTQQVDCYKHYVEQQASRNEINLWIDNIENNLAIKYGVTSPAK